MVAITGHLKSLLGEVARVTQCDGLDMATSVGSAVVLRLSNPPSAVNVPLGKNQWRILHRHGFSLGKF
jgi:hypothetical protein